MDAAVMGPVEFFVPGIPQPQGSKTAYPVNGRCQVVDKNPTLLKPWRTAVAAAALAARGVERVSFGSDAVVVWVRFGMPRGSSVTREYPSVRPDLDKLLRAVLDGITTSGLYEDDGQVVDLHIKERYSARPGARVKVSRLAPGDWEEDE